MKMTQRENMLRALRRDEPESVPFDFELYPPRKSGLRNGLELKTTGNTLIFPCGT